MKRKLIVIIFGIIVLFIFSYSKIEVKGVDDRPFVGQSENLTESDLYAATNTFPYVANTNHNRIHNYYNVSPNSQTGGIEDIQTGDPQITVLTHGLNGDASNWSNNGTGVFAKDSTSIISRICDELSKDQRNADIYWAVMKSRNSFCLYDLKASANKNNQDEYQQMLATTAISSAANHIIIVFEATNTQYISASRGYNYEVYEEFNYMLSKIVYDVKMLNSGKLPKINLIGHSRGGLTNLEYALDHPLMIGSVFSLGTPYFGSDTASTELGAEIAGDCNGLTDIIDDDIYLNYFERWDSEYNTLYGNINIYAIGGYSDSDFVFDALIDGYDLLEDCPSITTLNIAKWGVKSIPGFVNSITNTADLIDFLLSMFRSVNYTQSEFESYVQIVADIKYTSWDSNSNFWNNIWSLITHNIPVYGCPYFMNDLLVDLTSQTGIDEHSNTARDYGFIKYQKLFTDYENTNKKLSMVDMPAVVHNLEARDDDLINYILSHIDLGVNDPYIYEMLPSGSVKLTGYRGDILFSSISFPSTVDNYTVAEIGTNFFHNDGSNITSITIPNSITTIAQEAFIGMNSLEEVNFCYSSNLLYIGDRAFAGCSSLNKFGNVQNYLSVPSEVSYIGNYAFYGTDFSYVTISEDVSDIGVGAFSNISSLLGITVSSYNGEFFSYNDTLYNYDGYLMQYPIAKNQTSFTIPSQAYGTYIVGVLDSAFMNAENLSTINLGYIEYIGDNAFEGCSDLTSISIPSAVSQIGSEAFKDCESLNGIYFPSGLEEIGMAAFKGCSALDIVDIPSSVTKIGSDAFNDCSMLSYVTIARNQAPITSVGYGAFDNCHSTLQIEVPKNRIGDYKNKFGWNRYKTKVVPDSSTFPSYTIYDNSNITFSDSISAGLNKLYRLDVVDEYYYGIKATASYNTLIELYDSNLNFIDSSLGKLSEVLDSNTTYYVSISFESATNSGTISTQIKHFHDYDDHYVWQSLTEHKAYCYCMNYDLDPHVVSPDAFQGGLLRARCLLCNGFASIGEIYHDGIGGFPYTLNGSFILPNGVIVLEEADMEAYLNGTLVFINPNENIDRGNNHIPCIIRREDEYILD